MSQRTVGGGVTSSPSSANPPLSAAATQMKAAGDRAFERAEKTSAEFFAITYGALVRQMLVDHNENPDTVNSQLDLMGERIGVRLIEDFAAKSGVPACRTIAQAAECAARVGLKMYLGISANVDILPPSTVQGVGNSNANTDSSTTVVITFDENPLNLFVELPEVLQNTLWYSNVLCGVLRGALGQVGFLCQVTFTKDVLRGSETNEIRVRFVGREKETFKVADLQK
mmetsp:Transcript_48790/g.56237  ORF Transcript_48790/g.56237 Transcript_48790/m.56237 type:complete len:227 (+) Transcript_48790:52-732(+)|eukprot:CAMPEP_0176435492 /NCGR_PEP_ID=MMETSP0127-20121128/17358_1 /TAXON_ID=938130 /ORGANISM="Platyophrya macrostoma, Strain WH" /LENGTH=226 /DNA_ID=CAMNT_0017818537 /DNA_START=64 /DNA_END=744 /DNA_ORIENTATION=-